MTGPRRPTGLERLPGLAEVELALAGLSRDLAILERPGVSGPGIDARKDTIRKSVARLQRIRALHLFLRAVHAVWPAAQWPAWPPEIAVLDVPVEDIVPGA